MLLAEDWVTHLYGEPFYRRFRELGVDAHAFKQGEYFAAATASTIASISRRAQRKYRLGPSVDALNRDLVNTAQRLAVDAVFVFHGDLTYPSTLRQLSKAGIYTVGWQNDDPFGPHPWYVWRHFKKAIPLYERLFAYRQSNVAQFREFGCRRVDLLRSFYMREINFPLAAAPDSPYRSDVSFIGHWEPDGRDRYLEAVSRTRGLTFKLMGPLWDRSAIARDIWRRGGALAPIGLEYNVAINSTKIALCFLSKLNNDTYTRRCFEITAAGTFMLAEYSDDLASLFTPGVEAEYFSSLDEMLEKIAHYIRHDDARQQIAAAGRQRLLNSGHEAMDRAKAVLRSIKADLGTRG